MHSPIVAIIDVRQRCGHAALSHYRMGFTEERFANQPNLDSGDRSFNGGA
jgi:hypothetical protein